MQQPVAYGDHLHLYSILERTLGPAYIVLLNAGKVVGVGCMGPPRRAFLSFTAALACTHPMRVRGFAATRQPTATGKTELASVVASLANPYHSWWSKGGDQCAAHFNLHHSIIQTEGKFNRNGLPQMLDTIDRTRGNVVFNIDAPSDPSDLQALVELCVRKRVFFVTQNGMPLTRDRPWSPRFSTSVYVAHIDYDQQLVGYRTGRHLIMAMGGVGGLLVLGGPQTDRFAAMRLAGLNAALATAPKCHVLHTPANAEWEASASYDITRSLIAEHGADQVAGVWAANDDMALGAAEALAIYGRTVPVTGIDGIKQAVDAVQSGKLAATVSWNSLWHGGIGLSIALGAKTGAILPATEPHSHRAFFASFYLVTPDNVQDFLEDRKAKNPIIDWGDYWGRATGPIPDV